MRFLNLYHKKGLCVNTLRGHTNYIKDIVLVKNYEINEPHDHKDKMSIILSASKDRTIKMWHTKMEQALNTMRGHTGLINCIIVIYTHFDFSNVLNE